MYFAFNSNLSLEGWSHRSARNGRISYGDLFLNFSNPDSFNDANGNLFAIRFDANNDTGVRVGLYQNVTATSVTTANLGYRNLNTHTNKVARYGGQASYGDMDANTSYFNNRQGAYTTIASGDYVGGISDIITDFSNLGLDFGHFGASGTHTFGFGVDKSLLPSDSFIASFFAECGNDGIVLEGELKDVPESSTLIGLAVFGAIASSVQLRRRQGRVAHGA